MPSNTNQFLILSGGFNPGLRLNGDSTLQLADASSAVGAASSALALNTWYLVEFRALFSASANASQLEFRINQTSIASTSTANNSASGAAVIRFQLSPTSTGTPVVYLDDIAVNDDSGTVQNSWPGEGKVVLLLPISNNSVGNWLSGSGTSGTNNGNQWQALDNTPPAGTTSPDAVTACISNKVSGAGGAGSGDFNMATYASAGIDSDCAINVVQMTIVHGEDISTNTKTGTFTILSNPTTGAGGVQNIGDAGGNQFGPNGGGAVGTYPTNWVVQEGIAYFSPTNATSTLNLSTVSTTDTLMGTTTNVMCAQSFTLSGGIQFDQWFWRMYRTGSPSDNFIIAIQADNNGVPSGNNIVVMYNQAGSILPTSPSGLFSVPVTARLRPGTYWVVWYRTGSLDNSNYYRVEGNSTSDYAGGTAATFDGSSWTLQSYDLFGQISYYDTLESSVTLGSSPVCRITKTDTGTRAADCCFMGLTVDYTPANPIPKRVPMIGMGTPQYPYWRQ
jgi:hypothetical protein